MEDNKKKGLGMVLEGGGMRGLYTAGVLDELMEQGIYADSTVGVSAGAIFGCNYKSRQIGRTLRYNTRFCKDKRYMGLKSWITTGDLYSKDFAYGEVPWKLDVFDTETFARSPMKFTVVCTDIETGKPCYQECRMGDRLDVDSPWWDSMPFIVAKRILLFRPTASFRASEEVLPRLEFRFKAGRSPRIKPIKPDTEGESCGFKKYSSTRLSPFWFMVFSKKFPVGSGNK